MPRISQTNFGDLPAHASTPLPKAPTSWFARCSQDKLQTIVHVQQRPCPSAQVADSRTDSAYASRIVYLPNGMPVCRIAGGTPATDVGNGWTRYVHLDGSVYYYHAEHRVITPDDIEDDMCRHEVMQTRSEFLDGLQEDGILETVPEDWQLLIIDAQDGVGLASFLCHDQRKLIQFPEDADMEVQENTFAYWFHVEQFPMHLERVPPSAESDFLSALTFGADEGILEYKDTGFPYTDAQIEQLLNLYRHLKRASMTDPKVTSVLNWHIARTLFAVENRRALGKVPGKPGFSLKRRTQVVRSTWQLKVADAMLALLLFGTHRMYLGRLSRIRVEKTAHLLDFRVLVKEFLAEWSDSNLLATVFVGANIAFQQITIINNLQKTASLASAIFSILSVLTGVHHVWRHRGKVNMDINDAVKYVNYTRDWENSPADQIDDLAITAAFLAVPMASLMWSVLCFTVALAALGIQSTDAKGMTLLAVILGVVGFSSLAMFLFFWHVWKDKEATSARGLTQDAHSAGAQPTSSWWRGTFLEVLRRWRGDGRATLMGQDKV